MKKFHIPSEDIPKIVLLSVGLAQNSEAGARGRFSTRRGRDCSKNKTKETEIIAVTVYSVMFVCMHILSCFEDTVYAVHKF